MCGQKNTEKYGSQLYFWNFWRIGRFFKFCGRGIYAVVIFVTSRVSHIFAREKSEGIILKICCCQRREMSNAWRNNRQWVLLECCGKKMRKKSSNSDQKPVFPLNVFMHINYLFAIGTFFASAKSQVYILVSSGKRRVRHGKKRETNSNWGGNLFKCPGAAAGATEPSAEIRSFFSVF